MKSTGWWRVRRLLGFAMFATALWLLAGIAPDLHHCEECDDPGHSAENCKLCILASTGSLMVQAAPPVELPGPTREIWIPPPPVLIAGPSVLSFYSRAPPTG
jgi:hypothetical protein